MSGESVLGVKELLALQPLLVQGGVALLLMALIAIRRHHALACAVTTIGLLAAAALALHGVGAPSVDVTALLHVEPIGLFFVALFAGAAALTSVLSFVDGVTRDDQPEEYYLLLVIATLGASVLALAGHFMALVLGLEILSIALYGLIAYPERGRAPIEAALKYLVLSGVATATLLFGIALLYARTGSMGFADLGAFVQMHGADPLVIGAQAMVLIGLGFKLSLVPFHMWTPDVYAGAPAPVAGYLASIAKAAVVVALLRYAAVTGLLANAGLFYLFSTFAVLSMVIGNLLALRQASLARLLAYSSIAHLGYLAIALLLLAALGDGQQARVLAVQATMVYLTIYVLTSIGAFAVVGVLAEDDGDYRGLFARRPLVAAVLTVLLMSLAGLPLTGGFIAKFHLVRAGIASAQWLLLWGLILGSAIGAYYYLRVIVTMASSDSAAARATPFAPLVVLAAIGVLVLVLGVYPSVLLDFAREVIAVPLAAPVDAARTSGAI